MKVNDLAMDVIKYLSAMDVYISNLKLQKMLYYIQGYCLKHSFGKAFDESIVHWSYGPVVLEAYYKFAPYGNSDIKLPENNKGELFKEFSSEKRETIEVVICACCKYPAYDLAKMSRREAPWWQTPSNKEIQISLIESYFKTHDPLKLELKGNRL